MCRFASCWFLQALFRSVAMTTPDRELIAQVMLYSQGFRTAETLAKKCVPLFQLCRAGRPESVLTSFGGPRHYPPQPARLRSTWSLTTVLAMRWMFSALLVEPPWDRDQLSPQSHYDFGLRALKAVLVTAGGLNRTTQREPSGGQQQPLRMPLPHGMWHAALRGCSPAFTIMKCYVFL